MTSNHKAFRFSPKDMELIEEWKEAMGFKTYIETIRYALRRLGTPSSTIRWARDVIHATARQQGDDATIVID